MSKILVFSKCPNDVIFSTYVHTKNKEGATILSKPVRSVTIQGTTKYQHTNRLVFTFDAPLAQTEVDKDLWDQIVSERGIADVLLASRQIYAAKNEVEARVILKDSERGISDLKTPEELAKKATPRAKLI